MGHSTQLESCLDMNIRAQFCFRLPRLGTFADSEDFCRYEAYLGSRSCYVHYYRIVKIGKGGGLDWRGLELRVQAEKWDPSSTGEELRPVATKAMRQ